MTGWPVARKWAAAWLRGEDSQQLVRPHMRQRRNSTHVVPSSRQSWQASGGSAKAAGTGIDTRCPHTTSGPGKSLYVSCQPFTQAPYLRRRSILPLVALARRGGSRRAEHDRREPHVLVTKADHEQHQPNEDPGHGSDSDGRLDGQRAH